MRGYRRFSSYSLRKKVGIIVGSGLAFLIIVPLLTYAYFVRDIANEERLMNRNSTGVILLDRHGEEFYRAFNANATETERVPLEQLPQQLVEALIATEDRNFYEHGGYSVRGIVAALYGNVLNRDATKFGGSTITQQLAKNALLTNDKNYLRKYQELSLAIAIERHYEKDKILELYLNSVYFGEGAFGIEDAAQTYFAKPATELTLAESSILIGILPAPSAWSPITGNLEQARERQEVVLDSMAEVGYIEESAVTATLAEQLEFQSIEVVGEQYAIHFAEMVIDELEERYGEERVARSGFLVTTTLDLQWQQSAETAVTQHLAQLQYAEVDNGAVVAIDPENGAIRSLVGSSDWSNEEFGRVNMATVPRQPGSSFKPIYYAEALAEKQITPATILEDVPTTFGNSYEPENFDLSYRGDVTVRRALANSLNIPAIKVMEQLGVSESIAAAQRLGLDTIDTSTDYGLSLALGTAEVPLIDMTNAYAAFAASGMQHETVLIEEIDNKYGETIFRFNNQGSRVLDAGAAYLISSILSDESARAETFGSSLSIGRTAAVKTGTTEDNRDALTLGYTPEIAVGVWVGNNDNRPMSAIGGSTGAAPIWRSVMQTITTDMPAGEFTQPSSITSALICYGNGLRASEAFAGAYREYFLRGTLPRFGCAAPEPEPEEEEPPADEVEEEDTTPDEPETGPPEDDTGTGQDNGGDDDTGQPDDGDDPDEDDSPPGNGGQGQNPSSGQTQA